MENKDLFESFYESYQEAIQEIESHHTFPEYFYDVFLAGKSTIYQKNITETKTFDEEWIRTVESYFPSLNKISLDPKSVLRYDEEVVVIEKARKINSASIRHLAANTHNIKEVTEDGRVIPKKILTTFPEVEYGTYENRMVMTLIEKLFNFVRHRYEVIKNNVESYQKNHFNLETEFPIHQTQVKLKMDIVLKDDLDNKEINEYNLRLLQRVETLNRLVTSLRSSNFMQMMQNQKKVYPPLIKSNIIIKNPDYRNAYMLWLFLDRYNTLTFDVDVKEKNLTFDEAYLKDIYQTTLINFATIAYNQANRKDLYDAIKSRKYKKKGLKIIKRHPDDIIMNPDPIEIEDLTINQYYLDKFKAFFKKSLEYHEIGAKTYETSLKRALRDTIQITNTLYDSFFELNEEEDVFRRLITDQDPIIELKDAKEKALIAKMIREVKEVDYKESIRQEKRLMEQIAKLDKKLIDASKNNKLVSSKRVRSVEKLTKERLSAINRGKTLTKKLDETTSHKNQLSAIRKQIVKDMNDLVKHLTNEETKFTKKLEKELNEKLKIEKKKLAERYDREIKKIKLKQAKELERIKQKESRDQLRLKQASAKEKEKAEARARAKHERELEKERLRQEVRLQKEKDKLENILKKPNSKAKVTKNKVTLVKKNSTPITEEDINEAVLGLNNVLAVALKDTAKLEGIKNYRKLKKNEIIAVLAKLGYVAVESDFKLDNLPYKQLQGMAKDMNIENYEKLRKKDLVEAIKQKKSQTRT